MDLVRLVASMIASVLQKHLSAGNIRLETIGTYTVQYQNDAKGVRTMISDYLDMLPSNEKISAVDSMDNTNDIRGRLQQAQDLTSWTW
jgi:hypothetical protein